MDKKGRLIDGPLVMEFQSGNTRALVTLVERWHKTFCDKAFWMVKDADAAKDIAQDCWQVIIDKIGSLENPERFGAWALRIVYTKSIDAIKARNRAQAIQNQLKEEQDFVSIVEDSERDDIKQNLLNLLNTLPEHQQMVVRLFYVQDYSLKEISNILNISVGTTKSRLYHAREKLKTILKQSTYEN